MRLLDYINPYCWAVTIRNFAFDAGWLKSKSFNLPIISVGNLTVGGTGKTPHIEYIVNLLKNEFKVATLSRGYRRKTKGFFKAGEVYNAAEIGDEPAQIKKKFPDITVAVDEKRVNGIKCLLKEEERPNVILLDDAFQHRYVKPGLSIVLVDYNRPTWNDHVLPFGRLREPASGIRRAHAVIVTKCPADISKKEKEQIRKKLGTKKGTTIFFSTVCYDEPIAIFNVKNNRCAINEKSEILLLTGIARPEPLKKELERRGANVTLMKYPDHHHFTSNELKEIAEKFASLPSGNRIIITTEKDAERIVGRDDLPIIIKENIYTIPIKVKITENEKMFNQIIVDYVRKNQRDR